MSLENLPEPSKYHAKRVTSTDGEFWRALEGFGGSSLSRPSPKSELSPLPRVSERAKKKTWRLPTLPQKCSTIGVRALDFRVRDGNGDFHSAMATKSAFNLNPEPLGFGSLLKAFRTVPGCD